MRNWSKGQRRAFVFLVVPPIAVLFVALGGYIVTLLWNSLLPPLFGLPRVTFWQALGLLLLSRILFGGCGLRGGSGSHYRRRWEAMTPEERERVRLRMRERWGATPTTGSPAS